MNTDVIKKAVADAAAELGIDKYEIRINVRESAGAEALKDEITSVSYELSQTMTVRCVVDGKSGYASSELVTPEAAGELVERACANAEVVDEKDVAELFAGSQSYRTIEEKTAYLPETQVMKEEAMQLQRLLYAEFDKMAEATQSSVSGLRVSSAFINSAGLDLSYSDSLKIRSAAAAVLDGQEAANEFRTVIADKESIEETAAKAAADALSMLGADSVESGSYDLILNAGTARSLLAAFAGTFSARNAYMKTTLFAGKEGETVAAEIVSIADDPFYPGKWNHCPFDGEGVAVQKKYVIKNGILKTLLYNRMYAQLLGKETTGNASDARNIGPRGLYIEPGAFDEEALLKKLDNGIYITALNGIHAGANAQTGDFSLQAEGFLVENGLKIRPVKKFTVADNFYRLLKKVDAIGDTVEFGTSAEIGAPQLLVKGISVAGK